METKLKRRATSDMTTAPVMFTEECWANSMLSIARYYGAINYSGYRYIIVDKLGREAAPSIRPQYHQLEILLQEPHGADGPRVLFLYRPGLFGQKRNSP